MDLRSYYKKVRDAEATLTSDEVVLVSLATSEGGREGVLTEAPRGVAAKLMAEGRARVATAVEAEDFREGLRAARERWQQEEAARRMQFVVMPANSIKEEKKTGKDRS